MRLKNIYLASILILVVSIGNVQAADCYTKAEAAAEQGIRIHSELMVIALNCQNMRFKDGTNLYLKYRDFTQKNSELFTAYEDSLMKYYKKRGDKNPESSLNTLRTLLANNISTSAAQMKPDQFCNHYVGRLFKAHDMDHSTIKKWAETIYPSHPVSNPICD